MTSESGTAVNETPAKAISLLFHPLLMPLYGLLIIFSAPTLLGYLPMPVKKILFTVVLINNVVIPVTLFSFFRFRNIISSFSMEERRERIIPLLSVTLLYSITSIVIYRFSIPVFIKSFFISASFLLLFITIVNLWFKISVHSAGAGALMAMVLVLSLKMNTDVAWYLVAVIIAGGLIMSSRLRLNTHSPAQVWTGYLLGLAGMMTLMMLL